MTEIREAFPEIDSLEIFELEALRVKLLSPAQGDWKNLDDESLTRLWKITRALRKKAAHSGTKSGRKSNGTAVKKEKQSDRKDSDDLI